MIGRDDRRSPGSMLTWPLLLPGEDKLMNDGWTIKDGLDHEIDAVIASGACRTVPG
jgi:hypothetical protein